MGIDMPFRCIFHKLAYEGKLTKNYKHKCFRCDGSGRKCLIGYEQFLKYCKEQEGYDNRKAVPKA